MSYVLQDVFVIQIRVSLSYDSLCRAVQVRYTIPSRTILGYVFFHSTSECNHPRIYDEAKTKMWMLRDGISPFEKKKVCLSVGFFYFFYFGNIKYSL